MRILKLLVALMMGLTPFAAQPATAAPTSTTLKVALKGVDLERSTVLDLQREMDRGRLSSTALTAFYLGRIKALNPHLHAVIETNPRALAEAVASDSHRRR